MNPLTVAERNEAKSHHRNGYKDLDGNVEMHCNCSTNPTRDSRQFNVECSLASSLQTPSMKLQGFSYLYKCDYLIALSII